jgi:hypothetical protein
MSGKMNWDRVRKENLIFLHGSASVESGRVTDPPFPVERENQAYDIRCAAATGDNCTTYELDGRRALVVTYSLGGDFHSCPKAERKRRVLDLLRLISKAVDDVVHDIQEEFKVDIQQGRMKRK